MLGQCQNIPHERAKLNVQVEDHLGTIAVASCTNCRGPRAKMRVQLPHKMVDCPDCGHALFWERLLQKEAKKTPKILPQKFKKSVERDLGIS